jgi:hypothetical protein
VPAVPSDIAGAALTMKQTALHRKQIISAADELTVINIQADNP